MSKEDLCLIIFDQLRFDYAQYLPKVGLLLPYKALCEANSIPTSTETMHANISLGVYPKEHGIFDKSDVYSYEMQEHITIVEEGISAGYKIFLLGGKPQVLQLFGPSNLCSVWLLYQENGLFIEGRDSLEATKILNPQYQKLQRTDFHSIDSSLIRALTELKSKMLNEKRLFIVAMPTLDSIGHEYGPHSESVKNHLFGIDEKM